MDENKILEELHNDTEEITVPESLKPENIMDTINKVNEKKKVVSISKKTKYAGGLVAAAAVMIVGTFMLRNGNFEMIPTHNEVDVSYEESTIIGQTGNVDSYDDIYKIMEKYKKENTPAWYEQLFYGYVENAKDGFMVEDAITLETTAAAAMGSSGAVNGAVNESVNESVSEEYSKTNVQTVGIDEADIVKTDGKFIYYVDANMHRIAIYSADCGTTELCSTINVGEMGNIEDIYLEDKAIIACGSSNRDGKRYVTIAKYDISDVKNPVFVAKFDQEGRGLETRKVADVIYVVTSSYKDYANVKKNNLETYIPEVNGKVIDCFDIFVPEETTGTSYTVISSINSGNLSEIDTAAVLGFDGQFYMGNENMYIYKTTYGGDYHMERNTEIRKIDYVEANGLIGEVSEGIVAGQVKDTFAFNEYNGYLRVITTTYPSSGNMENNVFILDSNLKTVGSIEGLAKGERIYSARFMGDTAYFVTYRETDPLFSVDLSEPTSPKVMGELKIPGFSEYLHNYGDGLLLGIGFEEIDNHDFVKLSMFDISNPYNVTEQDKMIIKEAYYTVAAYDYKAVMIDPEKNIFGFLVSNRIGKSDSSYKVYTYKNNSFREIVNHDFDVYVNDGMVRGVYIGDYVYIIFGSEIVSYNIN